MTPTRRKFLAMGGGSLVALAAPLPLRAQAVTVIEMKGTTRGEQVWFTPQGLAIAPGTLLRFVNHDPGNSHTSTAYHPDILDRKLRIPVGATPWDSGFLLPDEFFEVTLTVPGVYDFYCQPHEHAGMVGRIVVGRPGQNPGWQDAAPLSDDLPDLARTSFPSVEAILTEGQVLPKVTP
jgi:plastocyanin